MMDRTRERLRSFAPFLALAAIPLVLLALNDEWIWDSTSFFDNHVYVGFFRHYLEFNYPYVENYKQSRLPFLLPGVLLYRLLPDGVAHHALFLLFLFGEAALTFIWARRRFGDHAGFAVAAARAGFTWAHTGPSYHNQPASMYFMAALCLLDAPARLPSWARAMLAGAAFGCAVTTNSITAGLTPVFGLYALMATPRPWTVKSVGRNALASVAGAALAMAALGAINAALGGPFLFFIEQVTASVLLVQKQSLPLTPLPFPKVWKFPWLTLLLFTGLVSVPLVAQQIKRRRLDEAALAGGSFLFSMALMTVMHACGLGLLGYPHLLHAYFTPMFMALAGVLGRRGGGEGQEASGALNVRFLGLVSLLVVVPLSLFGAQISRLLVLIGRAWPLGGNGSFIAYAILAAAVAAAARPRRSGAAVVLIGAGAFGLVNAVNTPVSQPAYVYDVRSRCSFRKDFFSALIEADELFSKFDPTNHARWVFPSVLFEQPQFDGEGWCRRLPVETVTRDILLTHYFYTTAQFYNGQVMPGPLRKLVISARTPEQADRLLRYFRRTQDEDLDFEEAFSAPITRPTFSIVLRGYDVEPAP
jgi:hypothetical protein